MEMSLDFVNFEDEGLDHLSLALLKKLNEKYEYIGRGRNRIVFKSKSGKYVIKVPRNIEGNGDNFRETKKEDFGFPVPKSRRIILDDFCCVIMEYVEHVSFKDTKAPSWVSWIDCGQVGHNRKGELVAYDYA